MINQNVERFPPNMYLQVLMEAQISALSQNKPLDPQLLDFDHFLCKMASGLTGRSEQELSDEEFGDSVNAVLSEVAFEAKAANFLGNAVLRIRESYRQAPSQFSRTNDFGEDLTRAFENVHSSKSKFLNTDTYFGKLSEEPITGLWKELESIKWSRRLHKRYIRSRFGMKMRKGAWKQSRKAMREREFQHWWPKNGEPSNGFSNEEIQTAYGRWLDERSDEDTILYYALSMYTQRDAEMRVWQQIIFLESDFLFDKDHSLEVDPEKFSAKILNRARTHLKGFDFAYHSSLLERRQELSLPYEIELAHLTALTAVKINTNLNEGMKKAIRARRKPYLKAKLEAISANIFLALEESKAGELRRNDGDVFATSIKNRVANMLRQEEPPAHAGQKILGEGQETDSGSIFERTTEAFALREEVRIFQQIADKVDLERVLSEAKLSDMELQVLELRSKGLTETEIATHLGIAVGTVRSHNHRIKRKILKSKAHIESRTTH